MTTWRRWQDWVVVGPGVILFLTPFALGEATGTVAASTAYQNHRQRGRQELEPAGFPHLTWESGYGHVAYVESVSVDGSWIVSEMNYVAFNTVDRRLIRPGGVPLIGFIY